MKAKITLLLLVSLVMASCSVENEETYLNENTANLETPPDPDPKMIPYHVIQQTLLPDKICTLVLLTFTQMVPQ